MSNTIVHKIGDSLTWQINYKQSDNITPVDLTGFIINFNAENKSTKVELFNIQSDTPSLNAFIDISDALNGNFALTIKDTNFFINGTYLVDIEYIDRQGYKTSSKSFELKVVERL